eukprot:3900021-Pyramimonas_sp.AAC.1
MKNGPGLDQHAAQEEVGVIDINSAQRVPQGVDKEAGANNIYEYGVAPAAVVKVARESDMYDVAAA